MRHIRKGIYQKVVAVFHSAWLLTVVDFCCRVSVQCRVMIVDCRRVLLSAVVVGFWLSGVGCRLSRVGF